MTETSEIIPDICMYIERSKETTGYKEKALSWNTIDYIDMIMRLPD